MKLKALLAEACRRCKLPLSDRKRQLERLEPQITDECRRLGLWKPYSFHSSPIGEFVYYSDRWTGSARETLISRDSEIWSQLENALQGWCSWVEAEFPALKSLTGIERIEFTTKQIANELDTRPQEFWDGLQREGIQFKTCLLFDLVRVAGDIAELANAAIEEKFEPPPIPPILEFEACLQRSDSPVSSQEAIELADAVRKWLNELVAACRLGFHLDLTTTVCTANATAHADSTILATSTENAPSRTQSEAVACDETTIVELRTTHIRCLKVLQQLEAFGPESRRTREDVANAIDREWRAEHVADEMSYLTRQGFIDSLRGRAPKGVAPGAFITAKGLAALAKSEKVPPVEKDTKR